MILGLGGKLSGGKTVTAVRFALQEGLKGKKILSNIRLEFPNEVRTVFMSNEDLVDFLSRNYMDQVKIKELFYNSVLLLDEAIALISARRSSTALNEMVTGFFMMLGKLNSHCVYTFQDRDSMIDKRMRMVTNIFANCYRVNKDFEPIFFKDRKLKEEIRILVIYEFDLDVLGMTIKHEVYDPKPFYSLYDTEEITLLDRSKYLKGGSKDLRK